MLSRAGVTRQANGWYHHGDWIAPPSKHLPLDHPCVRDVLDEIAATEAANIIRRLNARGFECLEEMNPDWGYVLYFYNHAHDEYSITFLFDPDDIHVEFRPNRHVATRLDNRR